MMKKIILLTSVLLLSFLLVGCTKETTKNIEGSLNDIMTKLYEGIDENEMPGLADNVELNQENFVNFAFVIIIKRQ